MRPSMLPALAAIFGAALPDSRGNHRSYYDPGTSPRPRNHRSRAYVPKTPVTAADSARLARAAAKRQRRAQRRRGTSW